MEKTTLKVLGDTLRHRLATEDATLSKELRRLIEQLERRQRERDQMRDQPPTHKSH
jgi:hypothetical protein